MTTNSTLLCIHRDPDQLSLLQERGYELVTAGNGREGLRLFMSRPVDAVVLEYHLGLLDGLVIAAEIRQIKPHVPIVMLADHLELPASALKSVDALVAKSDGPHFLLETVQSVLSAQCAQTLDGSADTKTVCHFPGSTQESPTLGGRLSLKLAIDNAAPEEAPLSPKAWKSIRNGVVRF